MPVKRWSPGAAAGWGVGIFGTYTVIKDWRLIDALLSSDLHQFGLYFIGTGLVVVVVGALLGALVAAARNRITRAK